MLRQKKLGYLGKQVLGYSVILLLVMTLLFSWVTAYVQESSIRNMQAMQNQVTQSAVAHVDSYLDQMLFISTQVANDEAVIEIMSELARSQNDPNANLFYAPSHREKSRHLYRKLGSHNFATDPLWRISVYNEQGDYLSTGAGSDHTKIANAIHCGGENITLLRRTNWSSDPPFLLRALPRQ